MRSARPLITMGLILLGLIAIAVGIRIIGHPLSPKVNPLRDVDPAKIIKITIENPQGKLTLERRQTEWRVTQPVVDVASDDDVQQLLDTLTGFSVGSVVAENDKRYAQFELTPGADARTQVWVEGKEKSILDIHIGKMAAAYDSCYVRFEGHREVHAAKNLMPFLFRKPVDSYRSSRFFPKDTAGAVALSFQDDKGIFRISKSSQDWVNEAGVRVSTTALAPVLVFLSNGRTSGFATAPLEPTQTGLANPALTITATTAGATRSLSFGDKVPKTGNNPEERYARVEGRDALLRVAEPTYNEMVDAIKKLR